MNNTSTKLTFAVVVTIAVIAIVGRLLTNETSNGYVVDTQPDIQTKVDIYQNFTIYSTLIDGIPFVIEIDLDTAYEWFAFEECDTIIQDDNSHNCVVVSASKIAHILVQQKLAGKYPNIKGE